MRSPAPSTFQSGPSALASTEDAAFCVSNLRRTMPEPMRDLRPNTGVPIKHRCTMLAGMAIVFWMATASPAIARETLRVGENARMTFNRELVRIAVGDPAVASVQMISNREILVLGRQSGQTNLLLWFGDGRVSERAVRVERDLTLLEEALHSIHPAIEVSGAPDQNALVLRGVVPAARFARAAESMTRDYLRGGGGTRSRSGTLIIGAESEESSTADAPSSDSPGNNEENFLLEDAGDRSGGRVINLIRVDDVPPPLEERLRLAVADSSDDRITVRRLTAGPLPDDSRDTFILEGKVRTQIGLVRALFAAARTIDDRAGADQIRVVADEAGSLMGAGGGGGAAGGNATIAGVGGTVGGLGGIGQNNLNANVARAKALSLAGGRILSYVEVKELPHVRIETRIYEVNRTRLSEWSPNADILLLNAGDTEIIPGATSQILQGGGASSVTPSDIQGAISLVNGGALLGGLQYVGDSFAVDLALGLLERTSIARALAKPTISVLSGEVATFSAGGQIPINVTVDTTTSAASGRLLSSTVFADFGVNVSVRPLVDENDMITLDVSPSISQPDFDLTQDLVGATGSQQTTTAFQTRSLRTTTRLRDGDSFVIGGLLQTSIGRGSDFTPWFHRIPGLGWLGQSRDDQRDELDFVVVITPSLSYEADPRAALWAYPSTRELLSDLLPEQEN